MADQGVETKAASPPVGSTDDSPTSLDRLSPDEANNRPGRASSTAITSVPITMTRQLSAELRVPMGSETYDSTHARITSLLKCLVPPPGPPTGLSQVSSKITDLVNGNVGIIGWPEMDLSQLVPLDRTGLTHLSLPPQPFEYCTTALQFVSTATIIESAVLLLQHETQTKQQEREQQHQQQQQQHQRVTLDSNLSPSDTVTDTKRNEDCEKPLNESSDLSSSSSSSLKLDSPSLPLPVVGSALSETTQLLSIMTKELEIRSVVTECINSLTERVEEDTWMEYVQGLKDERNRVKASVEQRVVEAQVEERQRKEYHEMTKGVLSKLSRDISQGDEYATLMIGQVDTAQRIGTRLFTDRISLHEKRDLSLMEGRPLIRLLEFLKPKEISTMLNVCRRWRYILTEGPYMGMYWKANLRAAVKALVAKTQRLEEEKEQVRQFAKALPKTVSVTITDGQKKAKQLSKSEIFQQCLDQVLKHVLAAQSDREDLNSRTTLHLNVKKFLTSQIQSQRAEYGRALAERTELERKEAQHRQEKGRVALEIKELEKEIAHQEQLLQQANERGMVTLRNLDQRIRMLKEMQTFNNYESASGGNGGAINGGQMGMNGQDDGSVTREISLDEVLNKMKAEKKMLVKAVKKMRVEIAREKERIAMMEDLMQRAGLPLPQR